MDLITKEVLDKVLENNLDFAKQMVNVLSNTEVLEKIKYLLKTCDDGSNDLNRLKAVLMDLNDNESKKYIQKLSDAISFFDETYSMIRIIECAYRGMTNGSRKYISSVNENGED